jgi:hypothetical protein
MRIMILLLMMTFALPLAGSRRPVQTANPCDSERNQWVGQELIKMRTIKPGMTRKQLLAVFTTEGGPSTALQETFASRDCFYFQVDVEFNAVGRSNRDRRAE